MELYLVRHAESRHNLNEKIQGQLDTELTDKGSEQAKSIPEGLDLNSFDSVYSSDLKRSSQTAELAMRNTDVDIKFDERLRERHMGEIQGENYSIWREIDPEDSHLWKPEGGESLKQHIDRMVDFVDDLEESDERVLIFTHGGSVRALIFWIIACESRRDWRFQIDNCGLTVIEKDHRDRWVIDRVNDQILEL